MREAYRFTTHALEMLEERGISREWVERAMASPSQIETRKDGTVHYMSPVHERGRRFLRVVVDAEHDPPQIVTVFFDRRLGRKR